MIKAGTRVRLESPHGRLVRGELAGAFIVVPNGSVGTVVDDAKSVMQVSGEVVIWDAIGDSVRVDVPLHWLAEVE